MSATSTFGPILLPSNAESVTDADEEVFLLYTNLQNSRSTHTANADSDFRGLGHVDSKTDTLDIRIELKAPANVTNTPSNPSSLDSATQKDTSRRTNKKHGGSKTTSPSDITLEVSLWQDKTALRSRKGDTGSVLWKASVDFARVILGQLHFPPTDDEPPPLLDAERLKGSHVLELGAGTGLLSILLSPFVGTYTVTDIEALLPLIRKNISTNIESLKHTRPNALANVNAQPLDWIDLHSTPQNLRKKYVYSVSPNPVDLLLIVDCIYHPSLLSPLLTTIDAIAIAEQTAVLVVVELRAEDVIREFLTLWLSLGSWEIRHVEGVLGNPYAMWMGWKQRLE